MSAPTTSRISIRPTLVSAAMIPPTKTTRPAADKTAPTVSKGRVGSAGSGSVMLRPRTTMITMMTAWKTKATRQEMAVVINPQLTARWQHRPLPYR